MKSSEILSSTWAALIEEGRGEPGQYYRRLATGGALVSYAGLVQPGSWRRLSFGIKGQAADHQELLREKTRGYTVSIEQAPPGYDTGIFLSISETDRNYCGLFEAVTTDLLLLWADQDEPGGAANLVVRRLEHWRRFFQKEVGLGREGYIGLCGELLFLEKTLEWGLDPCTAVEGWQGPLGSNQDFLYGRVAVEVKSTSANTPGFVRISSTRQLDDTGLDALYLSHSAFDFRESAGRTLAQIAENLEGRLAGSSPMAATILHERLLSAGFSPDLPGKYTSFGVVERISSFYEVLKDFPRIRESTLPDGVSDVQYTLDLASCREFEVTDRNLKEAIREASNHAGC